MGKGRKWFDCAECHAEQEDHPLMQQFEMVWNQARRLNINFNVLTLWVTDVRLQKVQEMFPERYSRIRRLVRANA